MDEIGIRGSRHESGPVRDTIRMHSESISVEETIVKQVQPHPQKENSTLLLVLMVLVVTLAILICCTILTY